VASLLLSPFPTCWLRSGCCTVPNLSGSDNPEPLNSTHNAVLPTLSGSSLHTSHRWSIFAFNPVCSTVTRPMPWLARRSVKVGTRRV
jgi:hypothetical protein